MKAPRARVVSSFTVVKGSLIDETYAAFSSWDFSRSRNSNLRRIEAENVVGAMSEGWLRQTVKVLHRRFDPGGRDRPLVELAQAGCSRDVWTPLLLWHMTRDEFLVRDFLVSWLEPRAREGTLHLRTDDVVPYLASLAKRKDVEWSGRWSASTTSRVASALLKIAVDFGLLRGVVTKEIASYHLPEESFLYLLHALAEEMDNAERLVAAEDWRMFFLAPEDVEREILRLHQFHRVHYEVAGSLARLELPFPGLLELVRHFDGERFQVKSPGRESTR